MKAKENLPVNHETAELMPDPGTDRWWHVEHKPTQRVAPIRVELREDMTAGRRSLSLSKLVGFENTIASPKAVADAANLILDRVAGYLKVIGNYGKDSDE